MRRALRAKLAALLAVIVAACGQAHGDAGAKASEPAPAASICQHYDPLRGFAQANIACVH
ncbi:hypothetical protein C5O80_05735 [Burkholderia sp. SRS-46]|nr:hypothetical protein C5O80_05735 [Burkholderia sp. SRS-46]